MTLKQKYKSLQNGDYVKQMITNSVYDTMQLEGQGIAFEKVKQLVNEVLQGQATKLQSAQVRR
jgi:hypothetical protein